MPTAYKVLGEQAPAATTDATLYTCPSGTGQAVVATIFVCNRGGTPTTFRIRVAIAGAAAANQQYLFYDAPIGANTTVAVTAGITLAATDQIVVQAAAAQVSFQAFGQELT